MAPFLLQIMFLKSVNVQSWLAIQVEVDPKSLPSANYISIYGWPTWIRSSKEYAALALTDSARTYIYINYRQWSL